MNIPRWSDNQDNPGSIYREQRLLAGLILGLACLALVVTVTILQQTPPSVPQHLTAQRLVPRTLATPPPYTIQSADFKSRLLFMGDTMLARSIGQSILSGSDPYRFVQSTLDGYNFRMANLETTIADPSVSTQAQGKLYTFNAPIGSIQALIHAHIDAVGLANNHTHDYGSTALSNMIANLHAANIKVAGAGNTVDEAFAPLIIDVLAAAGSNTHGAKDHVRPAIIAVNNIENSYTNVTANGAGSAYFDKTRIAQAITAARQTDKADIVIVFPHWGVEYQTTPTAGQISWGHFFIDSGADIVIGSHPHVVQATEGYHGKYIVYSMGNFIFDGMGGNALDGEMIGLTVDLHDKVRSNDGTLISRLVSLETPQTIATHIDANGYPELR